MLLSQVEFQLVGLAVFLGAPAVDPDGTVGNPVGNMTGVVKPSWKCDSWW